MSDHKSRYGEAPVSVMKLDLSEYWQEFMHYMYLPVRIPLRDSRFNGGIVPDGTAHYSNSFITLPKRIQFLRSPVMTAISDAINESDHLNDPYVYVTAKRRYAAPGNPLNRPGWHCDDFGGTDLNYTWTDRFPTRFMLSEAALNIPEDDAASMRTMTRYADTVGLNGGHYVNGWEQDTELGLRIEDGPVNTVLRTTPHVVHNTPEIPEGGGMRSFFKISVSTHRYDLIGNSHNYDLEYDWPMYSRESLRNQPSGGNKDYSGVTS